MTTLDNGVVIDESITALNVTRAADVPAVFKAGPRELLGGTVHHWGNDGQDFDAVTRYLASKNARKSSAHFVVQDGRVTCLVSPADAAWHAGHAYGTAKTIGIECRPEMTAGDLSTLESLIRFLEKTYGSLLVYKHSDWKATLCPGRYAGQINRIVANVNNVEVATPPVEIPADAAKHSCCCND